MWLASSHSQLSVMSSTAARNWRARRSAHGGRRAAPQVGEAALDGFVGAGVAPQSSGMNADSRALNSLRPGHVAGAAEDAGK